MNAFCRSKLAQVVAGVAVVISGVLAGSALDPNLDPVDSAEATVARTSAKNPMKPEAVIKAINRIVGQAHGSDKPLFWNRWGMDIRSATLTPTRASFKGKCNPEDKYEPGSKRATIVNGKFTHVFCYGRTSTNKIPILRRYSPAMNRLGTKAASSTGLSADTHGNTSRISATRGKATFRFAKDPDATSRQLQALTLRKGGKAQKSWYKR